MPIAPACARPATTDTRRGFTLVELSIVLVIIALLIGGILGGQELIKASRLLSTVKDVQDIREAIHIFQDKYGDLPGDMPDARNYWSSCVDSGVNTCNGNGDRILRGADFFTTERYRAWQHLSLSGIFPGNYTGMNNPTVPGVNVPPARFEGFYYSVGWYQTFGYSNNFIDIFGPDVANDGVMNAADAKSIDQKVDDGIAYKGLVFGHQDIDDGVRGCPRWTSATPSDYIVSRPQKECRLRFNWIDAQSDS